MARTDDSQRLLNYGFRFFESHVLYKADTPITTLPLYKGKVKNLKIGLTSDQYITIPTGQYKRLNILTRVPKYLEAPIKKGDKIGELVVKFDDNIIATQSLYALEEATKGGLLTRAKDSMRLLMKNWFVA